MVRDSTDAICRMMEKSGLWGTVLLVLATGLVPAMAQDPESWLLEGQELAAAGKLSEALAAFDRFKQHSPKDARSYVYGGRALAAAGRLEDARNELQQAAELRPESVTDLVIYARALGQVGWVEGAIEVLHPVEARLDSAGLRLLNDFYYQRRLWQDSLRVVGQLQRSFPSETGLETLQGEAFLLAEKYAEALAAFRSAAQSDPSDAAAQHGLGQAMWLADGSPEAKGALARAVELDPEKWTYPHVLALVCTRLDQQAEAIAYLEKAAVLPGAPAQVYFDLGTTYRQAGDSAKAREALSRYQTLYAAEEEAANQARVIEQLINQGQQQLEAGVVGQAVNTFGRVVQADPENWQGHSFLAKINLSSQRWAAALTHLERMIEIAPDNSEGSFLMAFYLNQRRQPTEALDHALRSRELLPGNPELRNLLGNIYAALGRRPEAAAEYRAAMNLVPDNPIFKMNYDSVATPR